MKYFLLLLLTSLPAFTFNATSQDISGLRIGENERHAIAYLNLNDAQQRTSESVDFKYTAIALKSKESLNFSEFAIVSEDDTIYFNNEIHAPEGSDFFYSTLIHFDDLRTAINLLHPEGIEGVYLVLINGSGGNKKEKNKEPDYEARNNCELPNLVEQSEWRSGLPAPNYERSFTTVENMIVHHSAYSNNITDYVQAVRDIYILHTQVNNWSDIGYNYLVAPDGTLFAGRDPGDGPQDQVMGAHFCRSNGTTMGVCLLGNFEMQDATEEAYTTLKDLLAWKGFKDNLNADAQNPHPLNPNLGVIAGHRDNNLESCITACPGQFVYNRLPQIRDEVAAQITQCSGEEPDNPDEPEEPETPEPEEPGTPEPEEPEVPLITYTVYPNPVKSNYEINFVMDEVDQATLENILVYDSFGKKIKWEGILYQENRITIYLPHSLKTGVYFLHVLRDRTPLLRKFVVL